MRVAHVAKTAPIRKKKAATASRAARGTDACICSFAMVVLHNGTICKEHTPGHMQMQVRNAFPLARSAMNKMSRARERNGHLSLLPGSSYSLLIGHGFS